MSEKEVYARAARLQVLMNGDRARLAAEDASRAAELRGRRGHNGCSVCGDAEVGSDGMCPSCSEATEELEEAYLD
jgi:rubrerythrin